VVIVDRYEKGTIEDLEYNLGGFQKETETFPFLYTKFGWYSCATEKAVGQC
jgi:hypothetical protein